MRRLLITDMTLRDIAACKDFTPSFREKVEIARLLDRAGADCVELPPLCAPGDDVLARTIAETLKDAALSCPCGAEEKEVNRAWKAIASARAPKLSVLAPVSAAQMEFNWHLKPQKALEKIARLVKMCVSLCPSVSFTAQDASRAEKDFLLSAFDAAAQAGATELIFADDAGLYLPDDAREMTALLRARYPETIRVGFSASRKLDMATACAFCAAAAGADILRTGAYHTDTADLCALGGALYEKSASADLTANLRYTELHRVSRKIAELSGAHRQTPISAHKLSGEAGESVNPLDSEAVEKAIKRLGYDLTQEDTARVTEALKKAVSGREASEKELEAVIAGVSMQAPPVYRLKKFIINSGNDITATAHITLEKDGRERAGLCAGDGPIDASFLAIEQIAGRHFELDDFQIQSVTEGREAMGDALVRLRHAGRVYSGRGVSTDIIAASIAAYLNALNKIACEEAGA